MKIEKGYRVTVKVDLAVVGGQSLEKSTVEYIQGGGSMLPGIEARLEPVAGIEHGGRLMVRGPNVMAGYLLADKRKNVH